MKKSVTVASTARINQVLCGSAALLLSAATPAAFSAVIAIPQTIASTPAPAGKHLYVAPTGSDSNAGTQAAPLKTIARADAKASAGYTIHVAPGTYKVAASGLQSAGILTTKSGTATARIKFVSDV